MRRVPLKSVNNGDILAQSIYDHRGRILLKAGNRLNENRCKKPTTIMSVLFILLMTMMTLVHLKMLSVHWYVLKQLNQYAQFTKNLLQRRQPTTLWKVAQCGLMKTLILLK